MHEMSAAVADWQDWLEQVNTVGADILARRGGKGVDVASTLAASRADLETRSDEISPVPISRRIQDITD